MKDAKDGVALLGTAVAFAIVIAGVTIVFHSFVALWAILCVLGGFTHIGGAVWSVRDPETKQTTFATRLFLGFVLLALGCAWFFAPEKARSAMYPGLVGGASLLGTIAAPRRPDDARPAWRRFVFDRALPALSWALICWSLLDLVLSFR